MPRRCGVCDHKKREEIDRELVGREKPFRYFPERYGIPLTTVYRHYCEHVPARLAKAQGATEAVQGDKLLAHLDQALERVRLLSDACDRWLRDPNDSTQYDVGPRSDDVTVVYTALVNGRRVQKREKLSVLLAKVSGTAPSVDVVEVKHADPRVLLLKAADTLRGQLELLGKLIGKLREGGTVNVFVGDEWRAVESVFLSTLAPHPTIRLQVADALERLTAASRN